MSQTPPQACTRCGTQIDASQRFCPNCGAPAAPPVDPTVAATPYSSSPAYPGSAPYAPPASGAGYAHTQYAGGASNPNNPPAYGSAPSNPSYAPYADNQQYGTPPPPSSPYNSGATPPPAPYAQYNTAPPAPPAAFTPGYAQVPPKKRSSGGTIILIVLVLAILGGGGYFAYTKFLKPGGGGGQPGVNGGGNTPASFSDMQNFNLQVSYAGDQITFTSLKQATKFPDDQYTTYSFNKNKNWVRLNFNENQMGQNGSYFSYTSAFTLVLPNGSKVVAKGSKEYSAPESGVQRPDWIDFPMDDKIDLSQLKLQLGAADEAQTTFDLKNNADLSKFADKVVTPNQKFNYAGMAWTLTKATQSLDGAGKRAKSGQIYITINLTVDNNTSNSVYLYSDQFMRLKAGATVQAPEYSSDLNKFDIIEPNTTNIQGSAVFTVPATPDGKYTLDFKAGDNINEQTVDFTIQ